MQLTDYLSSYVLQHDLKTRSVEQLETCVRVFGRYLGRTPTLQDLRPAIVNGWLKYLQENGQASETVRSKRQAILTLWKAAANDSEISGLEPPQKIRVIRRADIVPECWTHEQLGQLLAECRKLTGMFRKVKLPRSLYAMSLFNAKYDTALRIGDMQSIERGWIWAGGILSIVQHKPGKSHTTRLREETMAQIDELMSLLPDRRLIWPAFGDRSCFSRFFKKLVTHAGLRGSSKWIRRSSASYYEREHPGEAWKHLGHASPGLDRRSYLNPKIAYPAPQLPPRIA